MAVLRRLLRDESGQGMTEYAILIGTLALGAIVTLLLIGTRIRSAFSPPETPVAGVPPR